MMCLPAPAGWNLLLTLLRPHLNELLQQRERARDAVPELTPRQWELLRLRAAGQSNTDIANRPLVAPGQAVGRTLTIRTFLGVGPRAIATLAV